MLAGFAGSFTMDAPAANAADTPCPLTYLHTHQKNSARTTKKTPVTPSPCIEFELIDITLLMLCPPGAEFLELNDQDRHEDDRT